MAWLSEVPYAAGGPQSAELRLSWRLRSEPERACRRRTREELAQLPVHMREEEVCERRVAPYRLRLMLADSVVVEQMVEAAGARADRPLFVFARFPVAAGTHRVRVEFVREGENVPDPGTTHRSPSDAPTHLPPPPVPSRLMLDSVVTFPASGVFVVTYDDERRRLRLVAGS
jgi:hypothetical protein